MVIHFFPYAAKEVMPYKLIELGKKRRIIQKDKTTFKKNDLNKPPKGDSNEKEALCIRDDSRNNHVRNGCNGMGQWQQTNEDYQGGLLFCWRRTMPSFSIGVRR